ncbi:MAG: DUF6338 family protein [Alphaproteobacteria bacterium]
MEMMIGMLGMLLVSFIPGYVIWRVMMSSTPSSGVDRQQVPGLKIILESLFLGVLYQLLALFLLSPIDGLLGLDFGNDPFRWNFGEILLALFYFIIFPALCGARIVILLKSEKFQSLLRWLGFTVDQNISTAFEKAFSSEMKSDWIVCIFKDSRIALAKYSSKNFVNAYNKSYDLLLVEVLMLYGSSDMESSEVHKIWISRDEVKSIHFFNDSKIATEFCELNRKGNNIG